MTNTNKQALEDLDAIVEILKGYGDYDLGVSIGGYLIKAQTALQPKPSVDVEGLIEKYSFRVYPNENDLDNDSPFARVMRELHSEGHLNQGWREVSQEDIDDYIDGYEFRGDNGDHVPSVNERLLIRDAIYGLQAEYQIVEPKSEDE